MLHLDLAIGERAAPSSGRSSCGQAIADQRGGAPALHSKRRIQLPGNLSKWLTQALARAQQAPLTHEIAFAAYQLPFAQDPADRLIAATAIVLDLTLLTADEKLLELPV